MESIKYITCTSDDQLSNSKSLNINKSSTRKRSRSGELILPDYRIPTRKRTERKKSRAGPLNQVDAIPQKMNKEPTRGPRLKRQQKVIQSESETEQQGKARKRKVPGYYSLDQVAKRRATSERFLKDKQFNTFQDAVNAAKEEIRQQQRSSNQRNRVMITTPEGKVIQKDYHHKDYRTKENVLSRKTIQLLKEKNDIVTHDKAREKAEEWYRERNFKIWQRKCELKERKKQQKRKENINKSSSR